MSYVQFLSSYHIPDSILNIQHKTVDKAELTEDWGKETQTHIMIMQDDWLW